MVRFILACGPIPEGFEADSFFARYLTAEGVFAPRWLKSDGSIVPVPPSNFVGPEEMLIFENVPEVGKLVPGIHSRQPGVSYVVREHKFTAHNPAIKNAKHTINFAQKVELEGIVDHGTPGHTCSQCNGLGVVYEEV